MCWGTICIKLNEISTFSVYLVFFTTKEQFFTRQSSALPPGLTSLTGIIWISFCNFPDIQLPFNFFSIYRYSDDTRERLADGFSPGKLADSSPQASVNQNTQEEMKAKGLVHWTRSTSFGYSLTCEQTQEKESQ